MKKIFSFGLVILILGFILLYFSYKNGYYIKRNTDNAILTEEKIREYETDLKNGVDVSSKTYIVSQDNYDNGYSRLFLKISDKVEKGFDKIIKFLFKKISTRINE